MHFVALSNFLCFTVCITLRYPGDAESRDLCIHIKCHLAIPFKDAPAGFPFVLSFGC